MLVLSSYAVRTNRSSLGMRLSFVHVVDGFCLAFRRLIELQTACGRATTMARSSKVVAESVSHTSRVVQLVVLAL
jgi:hypothetical protein